MSTSTSYHAHRDVCPHCSRSAESLFVGRASDGRRLALARWTASHVDAGVALLTASDWRAYLARVDVTLRDGRGADIPPRDLWALAATLADGRPHTEGWTGYADEAGSAHLRPVPDGLIDLMPVNSGGG